MKAYNTNDVFGVRSKLIASYITREAVDSAFLEALKDGNEIIVYGSSKQGKTSLILKNLDKSDYVKVECSPQTTTLDIYKSILRQLNIHFTYSESYSETQEGSEQGGVNFKVEVPIIGSLGANAGLSDKTTISTTATRRYVEYNFSLAQDICEILQANKIKKYLVLENFHYLPQEIQENLAYDLRVFQDHGIIFIILGIWREANRLVQYNGDLLDRITEIPVEPWDQNDFKKVINKGAKLLNVDFSQIESEIIDSSYDSIGVIQELCKACCLEAGISKTSSSLTLLTEEHLRRAAATKSAEYGVRHIRNFESFAEVNRKTSNQSGKPSLAFPYYFVRLILSQDLRSIEQGLSRATLLNEIRKVHHRPDDVRSGDLGAFLHNIAQHQINKKIQPPFVDYDRGSKIMKIIDSSLYFFLKHCDRQEILDDLPTPFFTEKSHSLF